MNLLTYTSGKCRKGQSPPPCSIASRIPVPYSGVVDYVTTITKKTVLRHQQLYTFIFFMLLSVAYPNRPSLFVHPWHISHMENLLQAASLHRMVSKKLCVVSYTELQCFSSMPVQSRPFLLPAFRNVHRHHQAAPGQTGYIW